MYILTYTGQVPDWLGKEKSKYTLVFYIWSRASLKGNITVMMSNKTELMVPIIVDF